MIYCKKFRQISRNILQELLMSDNGNGLMRKTYMVEPVQDAIVKATA